MEWVILFGVLFAWNLIWKIASDQAALNRELRKQRREGGQSCRLA